MSNQSFLARRAGVIAAALFIAGPLPAQSATAVQGPAAPVPFAVGEELVFHATFGMLPAEYGGGGLSNVDVIIAAEELCAVDPGFACTVLVNGLGLMPVWYWGTEAQKDRFLRHFAAKMFGYALGRGLVNDDYAVIDRAVERLKENEYRSHALLWELITSASIRYRPGAAQKAP